MDQISAAHQSVGQAEALLGLITRQLGTSIGMLTLHGADGDPPHILSSLNLPHHAATAMAASIDHELAAPPQSNGTHWHGAMGWPSPTAGADGGPAQITFLYRATPRGAIGLTACRPDSARLRWDERAAQKLRGWIEPMLGLLWRAEHEHALRHGLARAMDRFDFGIVLLDADGLPRFSNARAQRLLDAGDGVRRVGKAIATADFDTTIRLQTAIRHDTETGNGLHILLLQRPRSRPLVAAVASLGTRDELRGVAVTALYLIDPDRDSRLMINALCRAHGLTPTESALTMHLVGGATVEDAANRMHVQTQTARAYLKQVFAKTGTHRQAELVRLLLQGPTGLRFERLPMS